MRIVHAIALTSLALTVSANPAAAGLLINFTVTPSVIAPGQSATLDLLLTPVFDEITNDFGLSNIIFDSGNGQTAEVFPGGTLLAPLDLPYSFTYLTSGTFTPAASFSASEVATTSFGTIVFDYFLFGDDALKAELTVVPEPATLVLFGSGLVGLFSVRRRKAKV